MVPGFRSRLCLALACIGLTLEGVGLQLLGPNWFATLFLISGWGR
ncbi:hypothetical protein [Paracoccus zhejiangensis]|nr:hypothetical protein [Paracoccus zhejiangensis]